MSKMSEKMGSGTQRRPIPDDLGQALLEVLDAWRPQVISLHDSVGETLWLSAGTLGPDEHSFVLSALDVFALEPYREHIHRKLEDGRRDAVRGGARSGGKLHRRGLRVRGARRRRR